MVKILKYIFCLFVIATLYGCSFNHYKNTKFDYENLEKYKKQIKRVQKSYKNIEFRTTEELQDDDLSQTNNPLVITNVLIKGNKYKKETFYMPRKDMKNQVTPMGEIYGNTKNGIEYSHFEGLDFIVKNQKEEGEPISKALQINFCGEYEKEQGICEWQFVKKAEFNNEVCSLFENVYYDIKGSQIKIQNCYSEKYGILIYHSSVLDGIRQGTIQTEDIKINKVKDKNLKPPKLHVVKPKRNS